MTVLKLIEQEIIENFPPLKREIYVDFLNDNNYEMHCSKIFLQGLKSSLGLVGFIMPKNVMEDISSTYFTFQSPIFGKLHVYPDLEQGYKITKL